MRNKKNKLIDRFEKENGYFATKHEKAFKDIKVNRRAVQGYLPNMDGKVKANLILSTLQSLLPHLFAKQPTPTIKPAEKVAPVDGDVDEPIYEQLNRFGETGRIVLNRVMMRAGLKKKARKAVRAAATAKLGVIKVKYSGDDPIMRSKIKSQEDQVAKLQAIMSNIEPDSEDYRKLQEAISQGRYEPKSGCENEDEIQRILESNRSLQQQVRKVEAQRGIHLDMIPLDQMRWDVSVPAEDMHDGSFISHFIFDTVENAKAKFQILETPDQEDEDSRVKKWAKFSSNEVDQEDQDGKSQKEKHYVKIWERWDADTSSVYTWIEGDYEFAKDAYSPNMFEDIWYPFFALGLNDVDGADLGLSVVETLIPLAKQYEITGDDKEEHRKAAIPFMMVDKGKVNARDLASSLQKVGSRDLVLLDTNGEPLNNMFAPGPSVPLNERLYDTSQIQFEMQTVSGVGDAERGAVTRAKTLGEAQIIQQGLATRTEDSRDSVEEWLAKIFKYSFALCLRRMSAEEVQKIAGDHAFWPDMSETADQLYQLVDVDIEAGSAGRPDKQSMQKVWFENLEMIQLTIQSVMQQRQQGIPDEQNPMYRLLEESFRRLDERFDITVVMPKTEVITSGEVVQSIMQQVQELAQTNPELEQMAGMAMQLLQQNPLVGQVIQNTQQQGQQGQ